MVNMQELLKEIKEHQKYVEGYEEGYSDGYSSAIEYCNTQLERVVDAAKE